MNVPSPIKVSVANDFSKGPGGRFLADGPFPGEAFRRKHLVPALRGGGIVFVSLDDTFGYGSSWLEEAFGGLVRDGFKYGDLRERLRLEEHDIAGNSISDVRNTIWGFIAEAAFPLKAAA